MTLEKDVNEHCIKMLYMYYKNGARLIVLCVVGHKARYKITVEPRYKEI